MFKLLPAGGKALLLFGNFGLNLLFKTGPLLTGCLKELFALLAGLIAKVIHLTFSLLPNRRIIDELLPLTLRLLNDFFCLLPGGIDELIAAFNQLCRPLNFFWKSVPHGIENFNGIPFRNCRSLRGFLYSDRNTCP